MVLFFRSSCEDWLIYWLQLNCSKGGPRTCWCCRLSARSSLLLHKRSFNKMFMASCSFAAISLHSLLTEAEFRSCWVTLQIDQSNHRLRSKSGCGRGDPPLHRPLHHPHPTKPPWQTDLVKLYMYRLVFLMQDQLDCCNLAQKILLMKATSKGLNHVGPSKTWNGF